MTVNERLVISGKAVWFYLGKLIWPHPLIFIYPRWTPVATRLAEYVPGAVAVASWAGLWWYRHRLRSVFFAATYFGVSLFPVLGFFKVYFHRWIVSITVRPKKRPLSLSPPPLGESGRGHKKAPTGIDTL